MFSEFLNQSLIQKNPLKKHGMQIKMQSNLWSGSKPNELIIIILLLQLIQFHSYTYWSEAIPTADLACFPFTKNLNH